MIFTSIKRLFSNGPSSDADTALLSRRNFLLGAGAAAALIAAPALLNIVGDAHAAPGEPALGPDAATDETVQTAQIILRRDDRYDRRNDDRNGRRHDDRGGRNSRRNRQRMSRRDLERRCRQDRRFRRENRNLCERVTGRSFGRRNTCIQIGPFQVCE